MLIILKGVREVPLIQIYNSLPQPAICIVYAYSKLVTSISKMLRFMSVLDCMLSNIVVHYARDCSCSLLCRPPSGWSENETAINKIRPVGAIQEVCDVC